MKKLVTALLALLIGLPLVYILYPKPYTPGYQSIFGHFGRGEICKGISIDTGIKVPDGPPGVVCIGLVTKN